MIAFTLAVLALLISPLAPIPGATWARTTGQVHAQQRETIFDRIVHIEPTVITEMPDVPRLEDSLGIQGRKVSVREAELWVEEEGSGIPLVLINGGPGGTHHQFHPWFGRAADFARVIYYDQRGCGLSDYEPGPDGYSVHQAMEDLEALRHALRIDRFVLAGFSYGGFLAQYYAAHYPENVAGLVLVGASPGISADLGRSRQRDFLSEEEVNRIREVIATVRDLVPTRDWTDAEVLRLLVYNNHLNGDWKRQHYYRPTREEVARTALYEWVHDGDFNHHVSQSMNGIDLTGAFEDSPIPTLIMEGEWDLTWGPEKKTALAGNHPNGELVVFEEAGHSIYNEDTEGFFRTLKDFVRSLEPPEESALAGYKARLPRFHLAWSEARASQPKPPNWGLAASRSIAEGFGAGWEDGMDSVLDYLRLGFALYDVERYDDALEVFGGLEAWSRRREQRNDVALGSLWQGHMLDLLGRREEAVELYERLAALDLDDSWSHDHYRLHYAISPWARERLKVPFQRIENRQR